MMFPHYCTDVYFSLRYTTISDLVTTCLNKLKATGIFAFKLCFRQSRIYVMNIEAVKELYNVVFTTQSVYKRRVFHYIAVFGDKKRLEISSRD